jgi:hypothetical protein
MADSLSRKPAWPTLPPASTRRHSSRPSSRTTINHLLRRAPAEASCLQPFFTPLQPFRTAPRQSCRRARLTERCLTSESYQRRGDSERVFRVARIRARRSREQGQGHRRAAQELTEEVRSTTPLLPARPPRRHQHGLRSCTCPGPASGTAGQAAPEARRQGRPRALRPNPGASAARSRGWRFTRSRVQDPRTGHCQARASGTSARQAPAGLLRRAQRP